MNGQVEALESLTNSQEEQKRVLGGSISLAPARLYHMLSIFCWKLLSTEHVLGMS